MYSSVPIFLSSVTLYLLATSTTTANGYPIKPLTSNINKTHIPFPVYLLPPAPAPALTNGKAHPTTTTTTVAAASTIVSTNIIEGRATDDTNTAKQLPLSSSADAEARQPEKSMHAVQNKYHHMDTQADADADTETHTFNIQRRGWFGARIENPLLPVWKEILEQFGFRSHHIVRPGGGVRFRPTTPPPEVVGEAQKEVIVGQQMTAGAGAGARGAAENGNGNGKERRMYGEGCMWGEVVDC